METDPRDGYIAQVVNGKSFADVGGLWGTVSEKVSVAHKYGASALAMVDVLPLGHDLWRLFEERARTFKLPEVRYISSDILRIREIMPGLQFDVVHCSGVLYHMPDPIRFLVAMRQLTREHLILNSIVSATKVESKGEVLEIPEGAALFVPALKDREREIVKSLWQQFVGDAAIGVTREALSWSVDDFDPWWWLPTVEAVRAMCRTAGFNYEDGAYFWNNNAYALLLSVVE
jgi:hypothetical protein